MLFAIRITFKHDISAAVCCYKFYCASQTGKNIGSFSNAFISHQIVFRPMTPELAKRSHEVVVVTPEPAFPKGKTPPRFREIDVHNVSYNHWERFVSSLSETTNDFLLQFEVAYDLVTQIFEKQLNAKEFREILNSKNVTFDLLLNEACITPAISLAYVYNVPVVLVSSFGATVGNYELFGASNHPIFNPLPFRHKIYNLTLWETIVELYYNHFKLNMVYANVEEKGNEALTRFFGFKFPELNNLKENVQMLFLNIHPIWDNNRPVPPNVIYIGGLHQNSQKDLPQNLKSLLDNSDSGVIYFGLGTNVDPSLLPEQKIKMFINVFTKLSYVILWKWHSEVLYNVPNNVKIIKCFPQSDLFRHPKVKLFITQGGLQSTFKTITTGVPLVGIPMLGDKWFNVDKYVHHGIGVRLDLDTLTEDKISNAINTVIGNEKYLQNIIRLRSIMHDEQHTPLERAVWWIEHVLRHKGGGHLRSPTANLTLMQYYDVEVVVVLFVTICFGIGMFLVLLRTIF